MFGWTDVPDMVSESLFTAGCGGSLMNPYEEWQTHMQAAKVAHANGNYTEASSSAAMAQAAAAMFVAINVQTLQHAVQAR